MSNNSKMDLIAALAWASTCFLVALLIISVSFADLFEMILHNQEIIMAQLALQCGL